MNQTMLDNAREFFEERCREHQNDQRHITFEDFTMLKQAYEDAISTKPEPAQTILAKQCPRCTFYYVGERCQVCESND